MRKSIFDTKIPEEDIKSIKLIKYNEKWMFKNNNKNYYITPSIININILPPHIVLPENIINYSCKINNIKSNKIKIFYDTKDFIDSQIKLEYYDTLLDGWLYNIEPQKNKYIELKDKKVWTCNYINYFYTKPPEQIYICLEEFN